MNTFEEYTMNDEFSKGVCSVVDGVVSDLKKVEVEMSKLKLFKCTFEVDTGVNYNKKVKCKILSILISIQETIIISILVL